LRSSRIATAAWGSSSTCPAPVRPRRVQVKPGEQLAPAREGAVEGVDEKALAEAARTGEEKIGTVAGEGRHEGGLVDIGIAAASHLLEGLDTVGELELAYAPILRIFETGGKWAADLLLW
jgi:hypothetical protein